MSTKPRQRDRPTGSVVGDDRQRGLLVLVGAHHRRRPLRERDAAFDAHGDTASAQILPAADLIEIASPDVAELLRVDEERPVLVSQAPNGGHRRSVDMRRDEDDEVAIHRARTPTPPLPYEHQAPG